MKKVLSLFVMLLGLFVFAGCEKVEEQGKYKEGTYFGYNEFESYGAKYVTTAVVYVNENGMIFSSPNCSSILLKSMLLLSIRAGVPVLKRYIFIPRSFRQSVK